MNQHNVRNKPRARRRRMKFSKVLLLSFLIALIMLILTLGVFLLMGLRYTSVPLTDGTSVAFFGWMKNGEMNTTWKILTLLFVSPIAGILLLLDK